VLAGALAAGVLIGVVAFAAVPGPVTVWLVTVLGAIGLLVYRFYRDPERQAPDRDDAIVSPADGEVVYVRESRNGVLPVSTKSGRRYALHELTRTPLESRNAIVIGIGLSFLDVHVNRAPIAGRVTVQRHYKGSFSSLRRLESVFENERATTVIERNGVRVAVVLIASRLVRRIVSFIKEGDQVRCGDRIGVIKFGSQVDLVIPVEKALRVLVGPGDRVTAGESLLATMDLRPSSVRAPAATPAAAERAR
jgi:phosphatidylserine decarboxylase